MSQHCTSSFQNAGRDRDCQSHTCKLLHWCLLDLLESAVFHYLRRICFDALISCVIILTCHITPSCPYSFIHSLTFVHPPSFIQTQTTITKHKTSEWKNETSISNTRTRQIHNLHHRHQIQKRQSRQNGSPPSPPPKSHQHRI